MTPSRARSPAEPLLGGGPRHRPPPAIRALLWLAAVAATTFVGVLLLSDRAPGLLRAAFGEAANRWWQRIDRAGPSLDAAGDVASQPDFVVHVVLWGSVTGLVALAAWSWRALPVIAGSVAGLSLLVEAAQGVWSTTREVERSDALANVVGVASGSLVAATLMLGWSWSATLLGSVRPTRDGRALG